MATFVYQAMSQTPALRAPPAAQRPSAAAAGPLSSPVPLAAASLGPALAAAFALRRRQLRRRGVPLRARGGARGGEAGLLRTEDQWIASMNLEDFGREVHELGERLKAEQGEADNEHLHRMVRWSNLCAAVGLGTMWMGPNPVSVVALSLWTHSAWTMMGHHVCHGGYNRTDETGRYSSRGFALGTLWRRAQDWFDWMLPEAWSVEHNNLHHYRLSEVDDPDLVERNTEQWTPDERSILPYMSMLTWKWSYYAPNTFKELKVSEMRSKKQPLPENFDPTKPLTLGDILAGEAEGVFTLWELVARVIGPYFLFRFLLLPLPLLLLGPGCYAGGVVNMLLADVLSNIHGFIVIVTNHAGNDLYRFKRSCKPKSPTFYLRAITASVNFDTGGDLNDFMHGWLNYQIEHHCWPDLSMLAYQKGQPELKKICAKHGVPYVQENVFVRLAKTLDIMEGKSRMRRYPDAFEREVDMMVWKDQVGRAVNA